MNIRYSDATDCEAVLQEIIGMVPLCGRESWWDDEWPTARVAIGLRLPVPVAARELQASERAGLIYSHVRTYGGSRERYWSRCGSLIDR